MNLLHRRRPLVAFVAVAALLLAQALGLAHGVAHSPQVLAPATHAHEDQAHEDHAHGFDAHHDEGSAECRLIDQAGHGDGAPAPTLLADVPHVGREARAVAAPAFVALAPARAYHARGPPPFFA
jgi:hypothetical protein